MRKGLLFVTPIVALVASLVACSSPERRSSFDSETESTEPAREKTFQPADSTPKADKNAGCSNTQTEITRIPVVIEFVVDESGSMSGDKWKAQGEALQAAFQDMQATADPATFIGLQMFHNQLGQSVSPGSLVEPNHYSALVSAVTSSSPTGSTGTRAALVAGYNILESFVPPAQTGLDVSQMKRALVLMSDGKPDGGDKEQTQCEDLAQVKFASASPEDSILTFAVGIGDFGDSGYDPVFMSRVAISGGTADPNYCDPLSKDENTVCHYQVTPKSGDYSVAKQKLIDAINAIRAMTASCEFGFTWNEGVDLSKTTVTLTDANGDVTKIPNDPDDGWSFDDDEDPTKVILNGEACAASNGTVTGRVDVVLGCRDAS